MATVISYFLNITKDPKWNIVDTEEEAHYILKYIFDDHGKDKAYLVVCTRDGKIIFQSSKVSASDWVPWHAGEESARKLYKKLNKKFNNH